LPNSGGRFERSGKRAWRCFGIAAAALALLLLPLGASKAGWLSDLLKSRKSEHATKAHSLAKAANSRARQSAAAHDQAVSGQEEAAAKLRATEKAEAARPQPEKAPLAKTSAAKCDPPNFHLVVDVGHTRKSDGALSARNVPEFEFNLHLATRLVEKLKSEGFTRTRLMVTEGKARPSLFERVATANKSNADLFLSIHHDSVPDKFMENWEFEGRKSKFSDRFGGWSLFVSRDNSHYRASLAFAKLIGGGLTARSLKFADQYTLPIMGRYQHDLVDRSAGVYRYDNLIVLEKTEMPAVLLEAGSIINRGEELEMASTERQDVIIDAVTDALKAYCGPSEPPVLQATADRK
jgi:N-acetylmuramoyl-L-alanine amidase